MPLSRISEWRTHPAAILVPALLQALALSAVDLPVLYIFRTIRCEQYIPSLPLTPDMEDPCRSLPVQKAYSADMAAFMSILTVMGIVLAGPYGTLSDLRGRRRTLLLAACFNSFGCMWLVACASFATLRRPWIIQLAAVLQGLGGGFAVLFSAHNSFIADNTRPTERSWYLGLSSVMLWTGIALGPLLSSPFTERKLYIMIFSLTVLLWLLYLLYVILFLRETRILPGDRDSSSVFSALSGDSEGRDNNVKPITRLLVRTFVEPAKIVVTSRTILLPSLAFLGSVLALGALTFIIQYCDVKFGVSPNEAAVVFTVLSICRAVSVVIILPLVVAAFKRLTRESPQAENEANDRVPEIAADEQTPLIPEDGQPTENTRPADVEGSLESTSKVDKASVTRELVICRVCLVIDAIGMLLVWKSQNIVEVNIATAIGSMGAPASPSLQSLVTMGSPPDEIGRVLAAVTILESLAIALRTPVFFPLYRATLEKFPGAIWWLSASLFLLCGVLMFFLRPNHYVR